MINVLLWIVLIVSSTIFLKTGVEYLRFLTIVPLSFFSVFACISIWLEMLFLVLLVISIISFICSVLVIREGAIEAIDEGKNFKSKIFQRKYIKHFAISFIVFIASSALLFLNIYIYINALAIFDKYRVTILYQH